METIKKKEKSDLEKELEKLKDFKLYVFEWDVYVKAEDYKEIAIENKKLKERVSELEDVSEDYDLLSKDFITLWEENEKLKSDLSECECSFWFESDEVWFWKREYKRLKKWIKDHCKWYWNLFPEDEMKRQWKKADKKRK